MKPHEKRAKAAELRAEAQKIYEKVKGDPSGRDFTPEELRQYDELVDKSTALLNEAAADEARERKVAALDAALGQAPERVSNPLPHQDPANTRHGLHDYSLLKAIRQMDPTNKQEQFDGLELETHQELFKRRRARNPQSPLRGFLVPHDLVVNCRAAGRFAAAAGIERRALTTTTGAGAVYETTDTTVIELLRNLRLGTTLGIRTLTDMEGDFSMPKQTGTSTASWITEGNAATGSNPTIGSVDFTPKTVSAWCDYSRKFTKQTSVDAEMFVREDLTTVVAVEMDRVTFAGSGVGAEPEGIIPKLTGAQLISLGTNGGPLTWAALVEMESAVSVANALMGTLAYVTNPKVRGRAKQITKVASSTFADWLWNPVNNEVNGYPGYATNQIPSNRTKGSGTNLSAILFGNWAEAIWALWGGFDVLVDPFTLSTSGGVRVVVFQDADFDVRHTESFSGATDVQTI